MTSTPISRYWNVTLRETVDTTVLVELPEGTDFSLLADADEQAVILLQLAKDQRHEGSTEISVADTQMWVAEPTDETVTRCKHCGCRIWEAGENFWATEAGDWDDFDTKNCMDNAETGDHEPLDG